MCGNIVAADLFGRTSVGSIVSSAIEYTSELPCASYPLCSAESQSCDTLLGRVKKCGLTQQPVLSVQWLVSKLVLCVHPGGSAVISYLGKYLRKLG